MKKMTSLEVLSNIKGAKTSQSVQELFKSLKSQDLKWSTINLADVSQVCQIDDLRADVVEESSSLERELIRKNFPCSKDMYLVVPKVLD